MVRIVLQTERVIPINDTRKHDDGKLINTRLEFITSNGLEVSTTHRKQEKARDLEVGSCVDVFNHEQMTPNQLTCLLSYDILKAPLQIVDRCKYVKSIVHMKSPEHITILRQA